MNKKNLLKTLLPISVIALIGGVTSSFVLTSCSKAPPPEFENYHFSSKEELKNFIETRKQNLTHVFDSPVNVDNYAYGDLNTDKFKTQGNLISSITFPASPTSVSDWYISFGEVNDYLKLSWDQSNGTYILEKYANSAIETFYIRQNSDYASSSYNTYYAWNNASSKKLTFPAKYLTIISSNVTVDTGVTGSFSDSSYRYDSNEADWSWVTEAARNEKVFLNTYLIYIYLMWDASDTIKSLNVLKFKENNKTRVISEIALDNGLLFDESGYASYDQVVYGVSSAYTFSMPVGQGSFKEPYYDSDINESAPEYIIYRLGNYINDVVYPEPGDLPIDGIMQVMISSESFQNYKLYLY